MEMSIIGLRLFISCILLLNLPLLFFSGIISAIGITVASFALFVANVRNAVSGFESRFFAYLVVFMSSINILTLMLISRERKMLDYVLFSFFFMLLFTFLKVLFPPDKIGDNEKN